MWYLFALGERLGYEFQKMSVARFNAGFAAPFRSVLPDFTYPARKDSRYGASLRQWRFAESCELGIARTEDPLLNWALARMYADDIPSGDTGRSRSSGEAERHVGPVRLSRADLGWRSLLFARASQPVASASAPTSLTIASQGLTIHRRDEGAVYVALDWGESGGGHGHPDRLNLIFSRGHHRWLDDLGTGSYVDRSLHWYRSTLAHNAPMVGGASQLRVHGELLALAEGEEFDVVVARAEGIAPGVRVERTLMTAGAYFIDEVRWWAPQSVRFELPVHFDGEPDGLRFVPAALTGSGGVEDGFDFVHGSECANLPAATSVSIAARRGDGSASATFWSDLAIEWFRARAPGQPASTDRRFHLIRQHGTQGMIRSVWTWRPDGLDVRCSPNAIVVTVDGATDRHEFTDDVWRVQTSGGGELVLERPVTPGSANAVETADAAGHAELLRVTEPVPEWYADPVGSARDAWRVFELGDENYRRSELVWKDAGRPRARVALCAESDAIIVDVFVETPEPVFVPPGAENPFDNEHPDINGHGVQLYFANDTGSGAWVVVPERPSPRVQIRRIAGWGTAPDPVASWRDVRGGFELRLTVSLRAARGRQFAIDMIVNDAETGRTRRRGQLVMSGAGGEFVYLRGDRHDPARLIPFSVT